jgi:hypothetical protein
VIAPVIFLRIGCVRYAMVSISFLSRFVRFCVKAV